ncbi:hypothetical protein [Lacinutrix chionoecetis]
MKYKLLVFSLLIFSCKQSIETCSNVRDSIAFLNKQSQDTFMLYRSVDIMKHVEILERSTSIKTKDKGGTLGIFVVKEDLDKWEVW